MWATRDISADKGGNAGGGEIEISRERGAVEMRRRERRAGLGMGLDGMAAAVKKICGGGSGGAGWSGAACARGAARVGAGGASIFLLCAFILSNALRTESLAGEHVISGHVLDMGLGQLRLFF